MPQQSRTPFANHKNSLKDVSAILFFRYPVFKVQMVCFPYHSRGRKNILSCLRVAFNK
jgi:hypothetical protein